MTGYGLTPEQTARLIAAGRDACNYFEHACMGVFKERGVELPPHNPNGCAWCAREAVNGDLG